MPRLSDLGEQARAKAKRGRQLLHKLAQIELLKKMVEQVKLDKAGLTDQADRELLLAFTAVHNALVDQERALYEEGHR